MRSLFELFYGVTEFRNWGKKGNALMNDELKCEKKIGNLIRV